MKRAVDGRYIVELPWKGVPTDLSSNKAVAHHRLMNMSKCLLNEQKYSTYDGMFSEWLDQGLIQEAEEMVGGVHYLPHHAVYEPGSSTTPVRPIFDSSCKIGKSKSINDCLHKGPNCWTCFLLFYCVFERNE